MSEKFKSRANSFALVVFAGSLALASQGCGTTAAVVGPTSIIDGTWHVACSSVAGFITGISAQDSSLILAGGTATYTQTFYVDGACATSAFTVIQAGTFSVGAAETTPAGAMDFNFIQASETGTALTSAGVTALNTGLISGGPKLCVGTTFALNTPQSIAGIICGGGSNPGPTNGATLLNIFVLTTTSTPNTFVLGSTNGGTNLGGTTRPTTTSSNIYVKQ